MLVGRLSSGTLHGASPPERCDRVAVTLSNKAPIAAIVTKRRETPPGLHGGHVVSLTATNHHSLAGVPRS